MQLSYLNVSNTMYPPNTNPKINKNPTATAVRVCSKNTVSSMENAIKLLPQRNKYRNSTTGECRVKKLMSGNK